MTESQKNTFGIIAKEVALALRPLVDESGGTNSGGANELPEFFKIILEDAGIQIEQGIGSQAIQSIQNALTKINTAYQTVGPIIEREEPPRLTEIPTIIQRMKDVFDTLQQLSSLKLKAYQDGNVLVEVQDLGRVLLEYLIADYLQNNHSTAFNLLVQFGAIELGDLYAIKLEKRFTRLKLEMLAAFLRDPKAEAANLYGWGKNTFDPYRLLVPLVFLLQSLKFPAIFSYPDSVDGQTLGWVSLANCPDPQIRVPLYREENGVSLQAGFAILPLRSSQNVSDGLAIVPYGVGSTSQKIDAGQDWELDYRFSGNLTVRFGVIVRFNEIKIQALDADSGVKNYELHIVAALARKTTPSKRIFLLGQDDLALMQVDSIGINLGLDIKDGQAEFLVELPIKNVQISLSKSKSDGFLQKILPDGGLNATFDLTVGWSNKRGLYFQGSSGFEATFSLHKSLLGVLTVDSIYLAIRTKNSDIDGVVAATMSVKLGPITAVVERIGLLAKLTFPPDGGNLGLANVDLGFKPPDGAGLAIDAAAIVGGGYLFFDSANEQYAGILQLEVKGGISLKAVGLLTTRLPGLPPGTKGFSLLVIISAEFPPIQLGFGFTLNGVGGLLGVNRTMIVEVLQAGIKNHMLDSILFPKDPVANAPQIISDLRSVFPPVTGQYVFGPMAILGWGTPPILTVELGIMLEFPSPVRLAIMGKLKMALPREEVALVIIQMDVLGTIDFDKSDAFVFATLYDSRVAQFVISGDMAMRTNWGASPTFALAAGGFNPSFQPPPDFPVVERLAISLATGDNPRLRLEAYLALTSNTVQFGARLDLYYAKDFGIVGKFSVEAYLGFDALFQFDPFKMAVDIYAGVALKRNGGILFSVDLDLHLTGPEPWHGWGTANFEFFGKRSIGFDMTFGEEVEPPALPPSNPKEDLIKALGDIRNWSAQLPDGGHMLVSLRKIPPSPDPVVLVHPLGDFTVHQRIVPLNINISKYGNTSPAGENRFEITKIKLNEKEIEKINYVTDFFARAQFIEMNDDEKLSQPSFEQMASGIRIGTEGILCPSSPLEIEFDYEDVVVDIEPDTKIKKFRRLGFYIMGMDVFLAHSQLSSAAFSAMRNSGADKFAGEDIGIEFREPAYGVATTDDMTIPVDISSRVKRGLSYTEAKELKESYITKNPEAMGKVQIVSHHEMVVP